MRLALRPIDLGAGVLGHPIGMLHKPSVKIGHIQRPVGTARKLDGMEPRIRTGEKLRTHLTTFCPEGRSVGHQYAAMHQVA